MSGSTAGGLLGAAIGFVASGFNPAGAQWGFFIGPAIGGTSLIEVTGPRLDRGNKEPK